MAALIKYDAACRAVAEAKAVDEVKEIRNQAIAMQEYARQSKNKELEADALEIRMRATRRLGEMMEKGKDDRASGGGTGANQYKQQRVSKKPAAKPTLAEAGIDKNLANAARNMASMSDKAVEELSPVFPDGFDGLADSISVLHSKCCFSSNSYYHHSCWDLIRTAEWSAYEGAFYSTFTAGYFGCFGPERIINFNLCNYAVSDNAFRCDL